MKPEVEANLRDVLNQIEWAAIEREAPSVALILWADITASDANNFVISETQAREMVRVLEEATHTIWAAFDVLQKLDPKLCALVNFKAFAIREHLDADEELPETVPETMEWLVKCMEGLHFASEQLARIAGPTRRGADRNIIPDRIATGLATAYLIGTGELPTIWKNATNAGRCGGRFGCMLETIFDLLGIGHSAYGPGKRAVEKMRGKTEEERNLLVDLTNPDRAQSARERLVIWE